MECRSSVVSWQECISALPDSKFFDIIRLYLGEIKTPYNKQRLIEQLSGFLRTKENLDSMMLFLDKTDLQFLTAIHYIPNATQNLLLDFFASEFECEEIYSEISNLISRLLIFVEKDKYSNKSYLRINPLIWDHLEKKLLLNNILVEPQICAYSMEDPFSISPDFIASLVAFIKVFGCSCKADGSLKKNDEKRLEQIFPGRLETIQLLINAFTNLSLILEGEKSFVIDDRRFELFAQLSEEEQYCFLCAAACSRFSRDGLKKEAQLLWDCILSIPSSGYTKSTLIKLAFLVESYEGTGTSSNVKSRFSRILETARMENNSAINSENAGKIIENMLDAAIKLGLLQNKGHNSENEAIYVAGNAFNKDSSVNYENSENHDFNQIPKLLNIDSTYTVTIMPGLKLKNLLPLTNFLSVKRSGIVTEYEITRTAASNAFDKGWIPSEIFEELEKYAYYQLPQNLKMIVSDWYKSYSSAMLYMGYVLKVAESNITFAENNPNIKKYIKEKLAEGVYLLNVPVTADISTFVNESGLEFMGKIKCSVSNSQRLDFPSLRKGKVISVFAGTSDFTNKIHNENQDQVDSEKKSNANTVNTMVNITGAASILNELKQSVEKMSLTDNQKEVLLYKINQRLVLNQNQLATVSIRTEILEAAGMDYSGKIHLFEAAIREDDLMEITVPLYNKTDEYITIVAKPQSLSKQYADTIARVEVLSNHEIQNFAVSRITHLRRLRY